MNHSLNEKRILDMKALLDQAFSPSHLIIEDESHHHVGHAGAQNGAGHFKITISSDFFKNKTRVQCHQMIYDALDSLMDHDIHALIIKII